MVVYHMAKEVVHKVVHAKRLVREQMDTLCTTCTTLF